MPKHCYYVFKLIEKNDVANLETALERPESILETIGESFDINGQDNDGNTVLHHAVLKVAKLEIIKLLLDHNVDTNIVNEKGDTAAHMVARENRVVVLKSILRKNSDLFNKSNVAGQTVRDILVQNSAETTVQELEAALSLPATPRQKSSEPPSRFFGLFCCGAEKSHSKPAEAKPAYPFLQPK